MSGIEIFLPIIISIGFFAMIAFLVWVGVHGRNRRAQLQAEVQTKLIEKFQAASDLGAFLESPAGQKFLSGVEAAPKFAARDRVISGLYRGLVLTLLGLAFLGLCLSDEVRNEGFLIAGAVLTALGVAFLLSTFTSYRMSKSLGLINGDEKSTPAAGPTTDLMTR